MGSFPPDAKKEVQAVSASYLADSKERQTKMWKVKRKPQIFPQNASARVLKALL